MMGLAGLSEAMGRVVDAESLSDGEVGISGGLKSNRRSLLVCLRCFDWKSRDAHCGSNFVLLVFPLGWEGMILDLSSAIGYRPYNVALNAVMIPIHIVVGER